MFNYLYIGPRKTSCTPIALCHTLLMGDPQHHCSVCLLPEDRRVMMARVVMGEAGAWLRGRRADSAGQEATGVRERRGGIRGSRG